ncbi:MAG: hypothetical protein AAF478_09735 [Pseudomonadota bacterium]
MVYALASVTGIFCLLFVGLFFQMRSTDKKILKQINLIARALRTNISETKVVGKKLDLLRASESKAAEFQKKTAEHHRVLLASLNQQIQRLEIMYVSENRHPPQKITVAQTEMAPAEENRSLASRLSATPVNSRRTTPVVKLEEIFQNRNAAVVNRTPRDEIDMVRNAYEDIGPGETELRRVLNG